MYHSASRQDAMPLAVRSSEGSGITSLLVALPATREAGSAWQQE